MTTWGPELWNERYAAAETVWGIAPNRWVEQEVADLSPGRAIDVACGEGRNAIWLATLGWQVRAVDFAGVALDKGRALQARTEGADAVEWVEADATTYRSPEPVDLALFCYLQLPAASRRAAVRNAVEALAPGGTLLVIGHDSRNRTEGTGGPQDPAVLFTADDVAADIDGYGLTVVRAGEVLRPVDGAERPAIDALLRAVAR